MSDSYYDIPTTPLFEDEARPSVHQAIQTVLQSIGVIGKNQRNAQQGFNFRGIDDVYNALHEPLAEAGVFIVPSVESYEINERSTRSGGSMSHVILTVRYTFYGPAGDSVSAVVIGEAADSGDKAFNKALSQAFKYAAFQVFCIPTKDGDADSESHEFTDAPATGRRETNSRPTAGPGPISENQVKAVHAIRRKTKYADDDAFKARLMERYGVESVGDLSKADASMLIDGLKKLEEEADAE